MSKGPDAFRTISEVAEELDIPQHVLRFWETRFPPIRPLKRGGGRRYYRPDDVDLLKGIRQLLYGQGYTIKGVQRILKDDGPRFVQGIGRGEAAPGPMRPEPLEEGHGVDPQDEGLPADLLPEDPSEPETVRIPARAGSGHGAPRFAASDIERLRQALDDLLECERVLESLRRD